MSNHPIIKALQEELAKECKQLAEDRSFTCYCAGPTCSGCETNTKKLITMGHEAATARLLGLLEKACKSLEFYGNKNYDRVCFLDHATCCETYGADAREFLTTLADASGEDK